jgi:hypothetical protein
MFTVQVCVPHRTLLPLPAPPELAPPQPQPPSVCASSESSPQALKWEIGW